MLNRLIAGCLAVLTACAAAPQAWAEDLAVIIANEFYEDYPRIRDGRAIAGLDRDFRQAGFQTVTLRDLRAGIPHRAAGELWTRMNEAERLVVVLSGHFVRTGLTNWLLLADADRPGAFTLGAVGFPLTAVMDLAAEKQGAAIVAVATDEAEIDLGPGTEPARFSRNVPQGVTFIAGSQSQVADFIANEVLQPGRILAEAARGAPRELMIEGFLPSNQPFLPRSYRRGNPAADRAFWQRSQRLDTVEAYESYLDRYPDGLFAQEAKARVAALRLTPEQLTEREENSLNLTRDQRREIQRNLSLLGHDPGGVDGIFGPRTRGAVRAFQRDNNIQATGYLSASQVSLLSNQAAIRAAELAAEAEARRLETERQDRAFWNRTGADGSEEGLRRYLQRYPDGLYADQAEAELKEYERQRRREARQAEREAWDRAVMTGTLESYQAYLNDYPQGLFADEARARVQALAEPETPPEVVQAARQEEQSLNLNGLTRSLIEGQLDRLGAEPGRVDGQFDRDTRRALRRYQRDSGLAVTGYVTREVIVRLLASAVQ